MPEHKVEEELKLLQEQQLPMAIQTSSYQTVVA
jgi:hypothetical protein